MSRVAGLGAIMIKSLLTGICLAFAALFAMAVVPALAQNEQTPPPAETQPPPTETQAPPTESVVPVPDVKRQSKPKYTDETPKELRLRQGAMGAGKCRSGASSEEEAEKDCAAKLNCQPPSKIKCDYRQNNQDYICRCK